MARAGWHGVREDQIQGVRTPAFHLVKPHETRNLSEMPRNASKTERIWPHSVDSRRYRGQRVLFDILKRWAANAYGQAVQDVKPMGCPWRSLAAALDVPEQKLRAALVHSYRDGDEALLERKLRDKLSFFHAVRYPDVKAVKEHWSWYLHCLTFMSSEFTRDGNDWNHLPEPTVVRMPLAPRFEAFIAP